MIWYSVTLCHLVGLRILFCGICEEKMLFRVLWKHVISDLPVLDVPSPNVHDHCQLSLFNTGACSGRAGILMLILLSLSNKHISEKQKKFYEFYLYLHSQTAGISESQELVACRVPRGL